MRNFILTLVILFIATFSVSAQNDSNKNNPTTTQSPELAEITRINGETKRAFREGKYEEALALAKQELDLRIKLYGAEGKEVAVSYSNIGSIYRANDKPKEALSALQKSLAISEKHNLGETSQAAIVMSEIGYAYSLLDDNTNAESWFTKAIATAEKANKNPSSELYTCILYAARFYWRMGQENKTSILLLRGIEIANSVYGKRSDQVTSLWFEYECLLAQPGVHGIDSAKIKQLRGEDTEPDSEANAAKGGVLNGKAISLPKPSYPYMAAASRTSGTVVVMVMINETGKVIRACALSGPALLRDSAIGAALKARFTPTLLDGKAVKVRGTINYNFR